MPAMSAQRSRQKAVVSRSGGGVEYMAGRGGYLEEEAEEEEEEEVVEEEDDDDDNDEAHAFFRHSVIASW